MDWGRVGGIWRCPNDERCVSRWLLRDGEERSRFLIFGKGKVFSIGYDAHDLDRLTGAFLKIAADGVIGVRIFEVEETPREFPIHNRNGWSLRSVAKVYFASRKQRSSSGGKVSGRDPVVVGIKGPVGGLEIGSLLREDIRIRGIQGEGRASAVGCCLHTGQVRDPFQQLALEMISGFAGIAS